MAQKDSQQPLADELGTTETVSILQGGVLRRLLLTVLRARSSHTGTQAISTVSGLQEALDAKLDAEDYSDRFKGSYVSLAALEAAHPTAAAGDFAVVDTGAGAAPRQYLWDADTDEWAAGSDVAPANTDALAEGASNFWFTAARVRDTLMTGVSFLTAMAVEATDSLLTAIGKLQAQIGALTGTVAAYADLPAAADNPGRVRTVTAARCDFRSNGTAWIQVSVGEFTYAEFVALDPADFPAGMRLTITDWNVLCRHNGTRFVATHPFVVTTLAPGDILTGTPGVAVAQTIMRATEIPVALVGPKGMVQAQVEFEHPNNGNTKIMRQWLSDSDASVAGAANYVARTQTNSLGATWTRAIYANASEASQYHMNSGIVVEGASNVGTTRTFDMTTPKYIVWTGQLSDGVDTLTLRFLRVTIEPGW